MQLYRKCRATILFTNTVRTTASSEGSDKVEWKGLFLKGLLSREQIFNYRKAFLWTNGAIRPESSERNHYYFISIVRDRCRFSL